MSNAQFCAGANATVTYTGTPITGASYTWNFNGGTVVSGSGMGPYQIAWNTPGTKTVTLTVSANGCTSTLTSVPVTVYQVPTSTFALSSNSVCDGQPVNITYNGNASPNATYNWTVNNNGSIGNNPLRLIYPAPGSYNIGLTVTENGCSSTSTTLSATVKPQPVATFTAPTPICTGQPEIITYTGTQITGASYTWGFNGAIVASGSNAGPYNVSWLTPGTKNITLTVNAAGCTASSSNAVLVNQMPTSSFSVSNTQFCAGGNATVTFNGMQVQGANYTWNFNGGNIVSGSGMGPYTINWDTAGIKQITLTVSTSGCTSTTTTIPVTIYQVPTSSFTTSASSICNGQVLGITYDGNASPNATYSWTVNNGGSVASNPLRLVYPTSGSYNITLNVTENGCSSGANTVPVTVYTVPTANFTVQGPICEGASVNVLYTGNANLNNAQFTWGWDGGTATNTTGENYAVQYASAGNYNLTLHVEENGCASIDVTRPLVVNAIPTSTFIATSPVCTNEGSIVTYTGSAPQNATYAWTFDGGTVASGSGQGPYNINWNNAGVKSLQLIVTHNGCVSPQTIVPVTVNDRPTAAFTIADTSICMGQPVTITYNGTGSPNATYNWTASGGATVSHISGNTYQMGYPGAGNYTVTLSVTELGCASATPVTAQVSVYDMPTSAFVSSGSPICDGTPLSVVYQGNASPNANFIWNVTNGATIGNLTPSGYPVNYPGAGTYNISLTVSENGCTSTQSSTSVIVYQTPTSAFVASGNPVCNGTPVDFYYNGNASPNATYNWDITGNAIIIPSGVDTFNLAYTGAGTYIVKLTVTEDGCSSTMSGDTITVFEVPVSVFAAVQNPVCDGQPVILNYNGAQIQNAVYTWTTPDSVYIEESGLTSYEVFYPGAGTYNVSLKVTANGCSSDTTNLPIVVNANPVAPFTASNNVCVGANGNIIYTGVQDPNYTYNWNFGGGNVVSGNNQGPYQITWATDGVKDVTLIVTNGSGCSSDTATVQVTVFPIPSSSFTVTGPLCTDANGTVYYTGVPLQNSIYNWSFDGANIVSGIFNGPYSLNWSTPGTKLITLDVTANGCTSPVTMHTVEVNPTPTASFMALDSAVCEGGPITLVYNGNASPSANYNWFTTGGATVSGTGNGPFTVNYPSPGTYYITLTVDENGCTSPISATLPVTVLPNPNAYFTVPVGECFGNNSYNFLAQGQFTFQADIAWNFGPNANVQNSSIINPSNISFNTTGAQTVSLTVTDNGCTSNFSNMVQVYPDPVIEFSADEVRGCSPLEVQFTDNSGYGDLATYAWNFGDGDTSSLQNPIHIYEEAGTYSPSLTITFSSACGGSITQSGLITVYPQPVAGFSATPQHTDMFDPFVTVVNDGSGATACYYTMGDGDTLMNTLGGTHEYTNAGVYTITQFVSNNFGCVDTAQRVVRIDGQFTIYIPNAFSPNNDGINDSFGAKGTMVNNFTLYIFDRWGELIFTGHGIDDYWDGSDPSGKRSQVDVYVYKVVYDEPNGDQKQAVGTVALID
ncbi:MAG: PKD domain-containing protein [Sphingobacteriales bacterium JAD_PAG50586_3]|nr:MAG: PKD domain-containing protein [Sphingobacteriales bacterium JAD_PAG50586_3]